MNKILRWIAYIIVAISAILIIWSLIGTLCHHSCAKKEINKEVVMMKHDMKCHADSAKKDSVKCKRHEPVCPKMAKNDSLAGHHEMGCCMMKEMHQMPAPVCIVKPASSLLEYAKVLLLLGIALLIITKTCCSCQCKDDNNENK
jgi:hypothetical protein